MGKSMMKSCFLSYSECLLWACVFVVDFLEVKYNTRKPLFAFNAALNFETDEKFEAHKKVIHEPSMASYWVFSTIGLFCCQLLKDHRSLRRMTPL